MPLMLEGKFISAEEAESIGLVHKAVEPEQLMEYTLTYAQKFANRSPLAIKGIKRCAYYEMEEHLKQSEEFDMEVFLRHCKQNTFARG